MQFRPLNPITITLLFSLLTLLSSNLHAVDLDTDGVDDSVDKCLAFYDPLQIDTDGDGLGDVCDTDKFYSTINTLVGTDNGGFSGDGAAGAQAQLYSPYSAAVDVLGNIYVADYNNHRIRKLAPDGTITTVAGAGSAGYSGDDGLATAAQLNYPEGVALDSAGNLYIGDTGNHRIRKVASDGSISTVAGSGIDGFSGDGGSASQATLSSPSGITVDTAGNLYIADKGNHRIRKVATDGSISTVAGSGIDGFVGDNGSAIEVGLYGPSGVAVDAGGNLYIADTQNHRIRKVAFDGTITTVAGSWGWGFREDGGLATESLIYSPSGITVDAAGNLYIADTKNHRIRKVALDGIISTVAGATVTGASSAGFSGDGGRASQALLNSPRGVVVDAAGNLYISDTQNHRIRKSVVNLSDPVFPSDIDEDYILDSEDNCPENPNTDQLNTDNTHPTNSDIFGDACDTDDDGDGLSDSEESRAGTNPLTIDSDSDGLSDKQEVDLGTNPLLDGDIDDDGVKDAVDVCILFYDNKQDDTDGDGLGDVCDTNEYQSTIETLAGTLIEGVDSNGSIFSRLLTSYPTDVAVDANGNAFIADLGKHLIHKVTPDGVVTTFAGTGSEGFSGDGSAAILAQLSSPTGITLDTSGNLYIADRTNHRIRKVATDGVITTVAGVGSRGFSGDDGPATAAQLYDPSAIAVDASGNLYIADRSNHRVRKVDTDGVITTVAGTGSASFGGDRGLATQAQLSFPSDVTIDNAGNLYIADTSNNLIRKVTSDGTISSVVGIGIGGFSGDGGVATLARISGPSGVTVDDTGNLFITDTNNDRIRKVTLDGLINTVAGVGTYIFAPLGDGGPALEGNLKEPSRVAVDAFGAIYIADTGNERIRKVSFNTSEPQFPADRDKDYIADNIDNCALVRNQDQQNTDSAHPTNSDAIGDACDTDDDGDGLTDAEEEIAGTNPLLVDTDSDGLSDKKELGLGTDPLVDNDLDGDGFNDGVDLCPTLYDIDQADTDGDGIGNVCDTGIYQMMITTLAGNGSRTRVIGPDGSLATGAELNNPEGVAVDVHGNVYIADSDNHLIRKVTPDGTITTVAGTGKAGFSGDDGLATQAWLGSPSGVAVDANSNIYIADSSNHRIRKVSADGIITTVAGNGNAGFSGDGDEAILAELNRPSDIAFDSQGNLYIADTINQRIRKVTLDGTITTLAGTGSRGFEGDGAAATQAKLYDPSGIALDTVGNLYIADTFNHRIRKVSPDGIISTIAGTGTAGFSGDGAAATQAQLSVPRDIEVDDAGRIYIVDRSNHRIREIAIDGTITTVAGAGDAGFAGDGSVATGAQLNYPTDIAIDAAGALYISDASNYRIRKVSANLSEPIYPLDENQDYIADNVSIDIDGNGNLNGFDLLMIQRHLGGVSNVSSNILLPTGVGGSGPNGALTNQELKAAITNMLLTVSLDVDGDGDTDVFDILMIQRHIGGVSNVTVNIQLPANVGGAGAQGELSLAEIRQNIQKIIGS
jgi:sugar lactone lactonase YvrE